MKATICVMAVLLAFAAGISSGRNNDKLEAYAEVKDAISACEVIGHTEDYNKGGEAMLYLVNHQIKRLEKEAK